MGDALAGTDLGFGRRRRFLLGDKALGEGGLGAVPEGADGKLWRFSNFALRHLWFFNVPNYIAGTPNALLVPREVAEKDGLTIRQGEQ